MLWDQPVHKLFETKVAQTPAADAVFFRDRRMTYRELNDRASQLAHYLVSLGIGPEKRVGLCVEPGLETVVGVLGILKAGGAVLPLDSTHPQERLNHTLQQCGVSVLLTQERLSPRFTLSKAMVCLDSDRELRDHHGDENPDGGVTTKSLAYLVFVSGRGILIEHAGINNRFEWMQDELDLSSADTVLHRTSPALDASVWEILLPLALGGRVVIAAAQDRDDPAALRRLIAEQGVSVARALPSELAALRALQPLRWVICGGEPLLREDAESFMGRALCKLYHVYGPPEAATDVTGQLVQPGEARHVLPVGSPVSKLAVYVLDRNQQLVPVGVTGEVCVAGEGLARGYLNDPEETRRRFLLNPFAETPGERMFRTGDLGRWTNEGTLELLGRADRQVWWRGWRVERSEIESALAQESSVDSGVVLVKETAAKERALVAYVVPTGPFAADRLRAHADAVLPEPLRPQAFVGVTTLPLTSAGEIDESVLLALPTSETELARQVEAQLLAVPEVEQAAVIVKPRDESPTLLHLADLLPDWKAGAASAIEPTEAVAERPAESHEQIGESKLSICCGGPLQVEAGAPATLPDALRRAASQAPDKGITYIQPDESTVRQSYAELLEDAERILSGLRKLGLKPQDKVLFQLERNQDFIPAFWGCVLGGFIPVPISIAPTYDQVNSAVNKLHNAWKMLDHPLVLAGRALAPAVRSLSTMFDMEGFQVRVIDELRANEPDHAWHPAQPDDLAILLLTSGSTGLPKAVMQKHCSILSRSVGTMLLNGHSSRDISFNWMPIDHVGGIVMFHVRDVYLLCEQVHAPTHLILQDPLKWLDYIERYRATITWAPNFAYGLVNDRADEIARRHWDLASMRFILNAGEAIVAKTARRFMELLQPHGLRASAMYPCWGMSETCSGVVYSHRFSLGTTSDSDQFVQVGAPVPGFSVRLVDAQDQVVAEGARGRLQVQGAEVTCGYYQNPDLNREVFTDDGWFKTGDLGVMRDGYLAIAGREKDVIIIRGINYYAHEIESVVEEVKGVQVSFTAACAVRSSDSDTDKLAIFFSPSASHEHQLPELMKEIRTKAVRQIGVNPEYLIPVAREEIPKTEIGKIQRLHLKRRFEQGEFAAQLKRLDLLTGNANTLPDWFFRRVWRRKQASAAPLKVGSGVVVLFSDRMGLGAGLCDALRQFGIQCVSVEAGDAFAHLDATHVQINPREPEHYDRALDLVAQQGRQIDGVLHLWTYQEDVGEISDLVALRQAQDEGVYSVLFLTQALARANDGTHPIPLFVVSSHAQAVLTERPVAYEKSTLVGLLKTIPLELAWLSSRHIDLETDTIGANVGRVLLELGSPRGEAEVVYRNGDRLVPAFARANPMQQPTRESAVERGGVYLVTGGLGGVGVELARRLIQNYAARLVLVGRTPLPAKSEWPVHLDQKTTLARRIRNYQRLEETGGEFMYAVADVCDPVALQKAVAQANARWDKPLAGIFHLAGEGNLEHHWAEMDSHRITVETRQQFEMMFAPKVYGTWTLCQLLKDHPQATMVSFSSVNALFGGGTFSAYSAANSFLDGCMFHRREHAHPRTWCVNWTMWDELGMSEGNPRYARDVARTMGYHILTREQGLNSLMAVLHRDPAHVIVGLDDSIQHVRRFVDGQSQTMQQLAAYYTLRSDARSARWPELRDRFGVPVACEFLQVPRMPLTVEGQIDRAALPALVSKHAKSSAAPSAPQTEAERKIAAIWQELLHVDKVSTQDNFFDLGGDSLLLVQFHNRLQAAFGRDLPVVEMFKYPTINALADYLSQTPDQPSLQESETRADARRAAIRQRRGART